MAFEMKRETKDLTGAIKTGNHNNRYLQSHCGLPHVYAIWQVHPIHRCCDDVMKPYDNEVIKLCGVIWTLQFGCSCRTSATISESICCIYTHWIEIYLKRSFVRSQYIISHLFWDLPASRVFDHSYFVSWMKKNLQMQYVRCVCVSWAFPFLSPVNSLWICSCCFHFLLTDT